MKAAYTVVGVIPPGAVSHYEVKEGVTVARVSCRYSSHIALDSASLRSSCGEERRIEYRRVSSPGLQLKSKL